MPIEFAPHENPRIDAFTDAERLRWVLEFSHRDLEALTSESLAALGDDLWHAAAPWWPHRRVCTAMPANQVRALQREICHGLQAVLSESISFAESVMATLGHKPRQGVWVLPTSPTYLVRMSYDSQGRRTRIWRVGEVADERTAILEGVANLLVKFGDRLCTCPVCGTPFLRQSRQNYCATKCSNRVRNRRRLDRQGRQRGHGKRRAASMTDPPSATTA